MCKACIVTANNNWMEIIIIDCILFQFSALLEIACGQRRNSWCFCLSYFFCFHFVPRASLSIQQLPLVKLEPCLKSRQSATMENAVSKKTFGGASLTCLVHESLLETCCYRLRFFLLVHQQAKCFVSLITWAWQRCPL